VLATEIKHFLGFGDTADERTGEVAASEQQAEGGYGYSGWIWETVDGQFRRIIARFRLGE
jgi:hypothetical protein